MKTFNVLRWALAGLAMAVVIYVLEAVANTAVLGNDWKDWAANADKVFRMPNPAISLVHWALQALVAGLAGAYIHAAGHRWVGKPLASGLAAGFVIWAVGWLGMTMDKMAMGIEPMKVMHINLLFAFIGCMLGGVAVSYIYKDKVG